MQHGVTVGAHWPEVPNWIDSVIGTERREFTNVVNMDISASELTVYLLEVERTNGARLSIVGQACSSSTWIVLIAVHHPHSLNSTFDELGAANLVRTSSRRPAKGQQMTLPGCFQAYTRASGTLMPEACRRSHGKGLTSRIRSSTGRRSAIGRTISQRTMT